ncbi:MAG: ROK family protein [Chitinispirillaceae bacterium]|nr:ROK family protein [Chitinispirillaceae bacterium]
MERTAIGIDIGGTTIKGAVVHEDGRCSRVVRVPTAPVTDGAGMVAALLRIIGSLVDQAGPDAGLAGVGIGTPGFVDPNGVIVGKAVNLPGWEGTRLYEPVMERFGLKAVAANDATAMTLAEARFGAGRGVRNLVCYALGTGVGGGIVADGRLYLGSRGMAGEFGHVSIDPQGIACGCGQKGCVERYASAQGIVHWARQRCMDDAVEVTEFVRMVREAEDHLTAQQVYDFVNRGDPVALRVNEFVCDRLARAIGITITTLAPDLVVLGGGVMMAGAVITDTIAKYLPGYALPEPLERCGLTVAALGDNAGVIGAGALVFEDSARS